MTAEESNGYKWYKVEELAAQSATGLWCAEGTWLDVIYPDSPGDAIVAIAEIKEIVSKF